MGVDVMISLQCSSSEQQAKSLNQYLKNKGFTTWHCFAMQGGSNYREEIVLNAAGSKAMVALMNPLWANSHECRYEFNIALRRNLTTGSPVLIPVLLEKFDFHQFPLLVGVMSNTNALTYNTQHPEATWDSVVDALNAAKIFPVKHKLQSSEGVPDEAAQMAIPQAAVAHKKSDMLPINPATWTSHHVVQWLEGMDFKAPKEAFLNNWVNGAVLLDLSKEEFMEIHKFSTPQIKRLFLEIETLKRKDSVAAKYSTKGFRSGLWEGYYEWPLCKGSTRDPTGIDVTMVAGVIAGYGSDVYGDFLVQGVYSDYTLEASWEKPYPSKQETYKYSGRLENGNTLVGFWRAKHDPSFSGPFKLEFKYGSNSK